MGKLIYAALTSLDGYIEDESGAFEWAAPDEEVHRFVNDLERPIGTHLYGRRMYETLSVWETDASLAEGSPVMRDYAEIWQAADKIVFSRTLQEVPTARTTIERDFAPDRILALKSASDGDVAIGGPGLASHAFAAGLVDELCLFLAPVVVGGGKRCLPDGVRHDLRLLDERRFGGGMVFVRYAVA